MSNRMPDRTSDGMSDGMSKLVANKVPDIVDCRFSCRIECQNTCQTENKMEHQILCHIERQIECPIDRHIFFQETRHSGDHTKQCTFIGNCHGCICISARPLFKFPFAILNSRGMSGMLKELLRSCKSPCAGPPENSLWQTSRELGVFELRPRNRSTAAQSFRSARTTKTTRASSNCANNRGPNLDKSI